MATILLEPTTIVVPMTTMTDAVTDTWRAIRRLHPDVPQAAVSVVPGRGSASGPVVWEADTPVVLGGVRTVSSRPEAILWELLHQAAHALAARPGGHPGGTAGRDASKQDRARS